MGTINRLSNSKNTETTIISNNTSLSGVFKIDSLLHIHGEIIGDINSTNTVVICKDGVVVGNIVANKVVISGQFEGTIDCSYIDILENGKFEGLLRYDYLTIEKRAYFKGESVNKILNKEIGVASKSL